MPTKSDTFLARATAGLASDPELRLDVQTELRSHLEDKLAELGGEEHLDEAVASLGEVVELAEEVASANQRRLGWRSLARRLLRFALIPASVVCALAFSGLGDFIAFQKSLAFLDGQAAQLDARAWAKLRPGADQRQRLLLAGDPSRTGALRYRTLWEQNPTNRTYYADYITHLETEPNAEASLLHELTKAETVDPGNGRYPLLAAIIHAKAAAELENPKGTDDAPGVPVLNIGNRGALDQAMAELLAATTSPTYDCHYQEMLIERLAALCPPDQLSDVVLRIGISAATLLPDMSKLRDAARYAIAYGELLIKEGHQEEAVAFLQTPERLARLASTKAFTLVEVLVQDALLKTAEESVPRLLRQIGREATARDTESRLTSVRQAMVEWQKARKHTDPRYAELLERRAGSLSWMLLPALGGQEPADLGPRLARSRELEFTAVAVGVTGLVGVLLTVAMLVCLAVTLRWHLSLGSQAAPLLLLPSWRDMLRFVLLGTVLPIVVFLAWTRWIPFSGHAYNPNYAGHRAAAELVVLMGTLLLLPACLALRTFRARCAELDLPLPPRLPAPLRWSFAVVGCGLVAGFLVHAGVGLRLGLSIVALSVALLVVLLLTIVTLALVTSPRHGRTVGTLSRSLVPVFAVGILFLSLVARPLVRLREQHLLRTDTILRTGEEPGFSQVENELIVRLRDRTQKAMANHPMPPALD